MDAVAESLHEANGLVERIRSLSNDALIIELLQTLNHLSRWLTPIHDRTRLEVAIYRSEVTVKDLLIEMRDTEVQSYSRMNAIAIKINPDLDRVSRVARSSQQQAADRQSNSLVIMSEFRRVRESSASLLRALPDTAWERSGFSRTERNWSIRELGEFLAENDHAQLKEIDRLLQRSGVRHGIAAVSRVRLEDIDAPFLPSLDRSE